MMENFFNRLAGLPMTVTGGVFLLASLILMLTGVSVVFDPAWVTVFISGSPILYSALKRLLEERKISSALLISIAMIASICIGELFAAGEVAFIMAIGGLLEDRTVEKAKRGIRKLVNLIPVQARRVIGNEEETVFVNAIETGDLIRVIPGETIAVDGIIVGGDTSIDQSVMTGESLPVDKTRGDPVFSGTINCFGTIDYVATRVGNDSAVQKLVRMVSEAEQNQAPMQRIVDKWASWLVPLALLVAVLTYFVTGDITRAVTVLVVFCPCALVLATPTTIMAAIGQATRNGVLVTSGHALEIMGRVDSIAFDKTGTLTNGQLAVSDVILFSPHVDTTGFLRMAASAEMRSEHPLGKAVVDYARKKEIVLSSPDRFTMVPGKGIRARIDEADIMCGNVAHLADFDIMMDGNRLSVMNKFLSEGKAVVLVARGKECIGLIALSDTLRPAAKDMTGALGRMGTDVFLLTGDHIRTARYFARMAGIEKIGAGLLPVQKVDAIREMQRDNRVVCMIGDGVNDAPALKVADIGVAMGSMGSDIAVETADIALMGDDLSKIPYLKKLSNVTVRTIRFNIVLSMAINLVAITLSVMGILNPITGAIVHNAGSVLVVLNAGLLYDRKIVPDRAA